MTKQLTIAALVALTTMASAAAGRLPLLLVAALAGVLASGEAFRRARARGVRPVAAAGLLAVIAFMVLAHVRGERAPALSPAIMAAALGVSFVALMGRRNRDGAVPALVHTMFPVLTIGFAGSYVLSLRGLPRGAELVVALVMLVTVNHAAWSVEPRIRPGREAERHVIAAALTVLAGAIAGASIESIGGWRGVALALLVSAAAPVGRSLERLTEPQEGPARHAPILAGIGGLVTSAPVFFYAFRALAR